nr:MAG TPA: hypothetical protein [Caudoviricetes sp.]
MYKQWFVCLLMFIIVLFSSIIEIFIHFYYLTNCLI